MLDGTTTYIYREKVKNNDEYQKLFVSKKPNKKRNIMLAMMLCNQKLSITITLARPILILAFFGKTIKTN